MYFWGFNFHSVSQFVGLLLRSRVSFITYSDFSFRVHVHRVHAYHVWIIFWISRQCCCWSGGRKCRAIWRIEGHFSGDSFISLFYFIWSSTRISSRAAGQSQREWTGRHIQVRTMWGKIMSNNKEKERKKKDGESIIWRDNTYHIGFSLIFSPWDSCTVCTYNTRH